MKRFLCLTLVACTLRAQAPPQRATPTVTAPAPHGQPPQCTNIPGAHAHPSTAEMLRRQEVANGNSTFLLSPEPVENIGALRFRLRDYADCTGEVGCYWDDLDAQTQRALAVLEARVAQPHKHEHLAMVLDIDETSLTSYCEAVREDFGYIRPVYEAWIVSDDAVKPIPGTLRLFRRARALGVTVFFITGRPEAQRAATERNLRAAGYDGFEHASFKQADQAAMTTEAYKSAERARILRAGYTLVLNVGDQWNDLEGTPLAEHSVKLPNPFYYLP